MAFRVPDLIIVSLCHVVSQALFPAYAKLQHDPAGLRRGFLTALRYTALLTVPMGLGMTIVASDFVTLFYTSRWAPSIPVMQMLALYALLQSISFNAGDVYKAIGRPKILSYLGVVKLLVTIPVLWIAAGHGIRWVAAGQVAAALLLTVLSLEIACRVLSIRRIELLGALKPVGLAAAGMSLAALALLQVLPAAPAVRLAAVVPVAASAYALILWMTEPETVRSALALFRRRPLDLPPD